MSEGKYISLGVYEKDDVVAVVDYLRSEGHTSKVFFFSFFFLFSPFRTLSLAFLNSNLFSLFFFLSPSLSLFSPLSPLLLFLFFSFSLSKKQIVLWGRSMGAATALMYCGDTKVDEMVVGMILDSPFASLNELAHDIVGKFQLPLLAQF